METGIEEILEEASLATKGRRFKEAARLYRLILKTTSKHPVASHNLGVIEALNGNFEEALTLLKCAVEANAHQDQFWFSYIETLIKTNDFRKAIETIDQAEKLGINGRELKELRSRIKLKPQVNMRVVDNLAVRIQDLEHLYKDGKFNDARILAKSLTTSCPLNPIVWKVLGASSGNLGAVDEALIATQKCIELAPQDEEAYNNLGTIYQEMGRRKEAIQAYCRALTIRTDYEHALYNLGLSLNGVVFKAPSPRLQVIINSILKNTKLSRPKDIAPAAISLLKLNFIDDKTFRDFSRLSLEYSAQEIALALSRIPLLLTLMRTCPIADLEIEEFLKKVRSDLVFNFAEFNSSKELQDVQSALAQQCFINEYIYEETREEVKEVERIEQSVRNDLENRLEPNPCSILCLASYKPLHELPFHIWLKPNSAIAEVFRQQVVEPTQEDRIKVNFPSLSHIKNQVSKNVRHQYEKYPYPRWVNLRLELMPKTLELIFKQLNLKVSCDKIFAKKEPEILIAGCGTGAHPISTASRIEGSNLLAIDLSLSSLAYAKRKTDEFGLNNVTYMHADILSLQELNRKFDVIESVGVLHHMENPSTGLEILCDLLNDGGLMRLGLYSQFARRDISILRREIANSELEINDSSIKSLRRDLINSAKSTAYRITNSPDFYSLSTFKDLLFHEQEHHLSLMQLNEFLGNLGLEFCGFSNVGLVENFKSKCKCAKDVYNLTKWHAFEEENPHIFGDMYQFWCQKI